MPGNSQRARVPGTWLQCLERPTRRFARVLAAGEQSSWLAGQKRHIEQVWF